MSFAQEKPRSIIDSFKKIRHLDTAQENDIVEEMIDSAQSIRERETLGIDKETEEVLRTLKNPFIPQLPQQATTPAASNREKGPVETQPSPTDDRTPSEPPPATRPDFTVSGLVWNTNKPQAIVNGKIVTVGDALDEWIITTISQNGVEIQKENQIFNIEQKKTPVGENTRMDSSKRAPRNSVSTASRSAASREQRRPNSQYKQPRNQ